MTGNSAQHRYEHAGRSGEVTALGRAIETLRPIRTVIHSNQAVEFASGLQATYDGVRARALNGLYRVSPATQMT